MTDHAPLLLLACLMGQYCFARWRLSAFAVFLSL